MRTVAGILLLISGTIFPLAMVAWLSARLNRQPRPAPRQVGLILALNGLLPAGLVLFGVGLLAPQLWALAWLRVAAIAACVCAALVFLALVWAGAREVQK